MEDFQETMNTILVEVYYNILRLEERALQKASNNQISVSEMHMLECIGQGGAQGVTNRSIAQAMHITPPSVTAAIKKLVRKGYVQKCSSDEDGRQVRLSLTSEGKRMDAYHRLYHHEMVSQVEEEFSQEEQALLLRMIARLNQFFQEYTGDNK